MEGRKWVCHTYKGWQKLMPFWSENTIKRTVRLLEKQGVLISANWNCLKIDKTKWYTFDFELMKELNMDIQVPSNNQIESEDQTSYLSDQSINQVEPNRVPDCAVEEVVMNKAIQEITTENTTEIKEYIPVSEGSDYLNRKINTF